MKFAAFYLLFIAGAVNAQEFGLNKAMTVNKFAIACQHPASKTDPDRRIDACISFLNSNVADVKKKNGTPTCLAVEPSRTAPMVISDVLYSMATDPDEKNMLAFEAIEAVVGIAAPECKIKKVSRKSI